VSEAPTEIPSDIADRLRVQHELIEAGKSLSSEQTIEGVLRRIVELACQLVDAKYGALGVLDAPGEQLAQFITVGIDDETRRQIGDLPTGRGILGVLIHDPKPLRLRKLSDDPRSVGFPDHHPPMNSFLGVPIVARGEVKGRIYLTEKQGAAEFSEHDEWVTVTLASQAAVAIESVELFEASRAAATALEITNEQLEVASRHKSTFLANVSHELRTPLNSIIGYTTLLIEDSDNLTPEQLDDLHVIKSSGTHLLSLISDLLDLSRIETGHMDLQIAHTDVAQLLRDTAASLRPQVESSGVELAVKAPGTLVIECDRSRVRQMLLNVLGNAVKFTEEGRIDASLVSTDEGGAHFEICDTGPGIPNEDIDRIFESFFQSGAALARTPRTSEGAGLGLAITRMLADLHGGTVSIASELGEGTTITIDLPATARPGGLTHE
jgi:signal transduction histidine kinase